MKRSQGNFLRNCVILLIMSMNNTAALSFAQENTQYILEKNQSLTEMEITEGKSFLKSLHALVTNPPITPDKVSIVFGWPIIKKSASGNIQYTEFNSYLNDSSSKPQLREFSDGHIDLVVRFSSAALCIPSESIVSEFGDDYKPTRATIDTLTEAAPKDIVRSEAMKMNLARFLYGPRYSLPSPVNISIEFSYIHSECLDSIYVIRQK